MAGWTYSCDDLLDALLVRLHLQEGLDLADGQVLPVAQSNQLVEGAEELVGISHDLALIESLAGARDDLGEEVERVNVLEDVGLAVRDEHHVELVEGLVHEADIVLLDGRVLSASVGQLGERCQETLNARPGHLAELPGEDSFTAAGTDGCGEDDLGTPNVSMATTAATMARSIHAYHLALCWLLAVRVWN